MIIIHGILKFGRKKTGYRNDFCRTCEDQRIAEQFRSIDFYHFFFVFLIPLGIRKRWVCTECGRDPHVHPGVRMRPVFKYLLLAFFAFFFLVSLLPSSEAGAEAWKARGIWFLICAAIFIWIRATRGEKIVAMKSVRLASLTGEDCLNCGGPLEPFGDGAWNCPACGLKRFPPAFEEQDAPSWNYL